ncbi:MAG: hypothetical protein H7X95_04915 [Deltaproteobacteria bacterium]|nr:hypothetical protein [Deltaproteobacteria bacterium]
MNILRTAFVVSFSCTALFVGCGSSSSSSSTDRLALCKESCAKTASLCFADAGATGAAIKAGCESSCTTATGTGSNTTCSNANEVVAAVKVCLTKNTCEEYTSCFETVPECTGGGSGGASGARTGGASGTGTGGGTGTGTGGTSGGGGSTGTGSGGCADLTACCNAIADANLKPACQLQVTMIQAMVTSGSVTQTQANNVCTQALAVVKPFYCP